MKWSSLLLLIAAVSLTGADLRLGIIGTDTSHATAFTKALNDAQSPNHVDGARVVVAYKGGSADIEESAKRVDQYASELQQKYGVKLVPTIGDLCSQVDGILLESVDGRPHLSQFREAVRCGKPVFIDKPLASTLSDALEIARLAKESNIPWFSSSTLRFSPISEMRSPDMTGAMVWAPGPLESHHQLDLSWYGIHGVEMLYTLMGTGCVEVSRMSSRDTEVITGKWSDGRLGTVHLQRPYGKYGGVVFLKGEKVNAQADIAIDYVPLVKQIVTFMQTKTLPVPNEETLEMFRFMEASQRSVAQNGAAVRIEP